MTLPDFLSIIAGFRLHMLTLHAHVDNTQGPGRHACPSTCVKVFHTFTMLISWMLLFFLVSECVLEAPSATLPL